MRKQLNEDLNEVNNKLRSQKNAYDAYVDSHNLKKQALRTYVADYKDIKIKEFNFPQKAVQAAKRYENKTEQLKNVVKGDYSGYNRYRKNNNSQLGISNYTEPMQMGHVKRILSDMEIGFENAKVKIIRNTDLIGTGYYGWTNPNMKEVQLYPDAFVSREELVKTLGHERVHLEQLKLFGPSNNNDEAIYFEKGPRFSEEYWWEEYKRKVNYNGSSN